MLDIYKKLETFIDKENEEQSKEREGKERTTWYASELGNCPRGTYYKRLGVEPDEELDARTKRVFKCGNIFEDFILDRLIDGDHTLEREVRVENKELHISGRIDGLITYKDGTQEILEIKSKHSGAFHKMRKEGEAMRQHQYQIWVYLNEMNIEKGRIVYISKDDLCIETYEVRLDDKQLKKEVLWKVGLLNRAWAEKNPNLLPLPQDGSWQKKYCSYHSNCTKDEV